MPTYATLCLTILIGGLLPVQFALNAKLALSAGATVIWGALVSVVVSTLVLLSLNGATLARWPKFSDLSAIPWWLWTGGVMGALFVAGSTFAVPRLGATTYVAAVLFGQICVSLTIDHAGWFGVPKDPVTLQRFFGAGLIFVGLMVVRSA